MNDPRNSTYVVGFNDTIEGVMAAIERNNHRSVIVIDDTGRVMGTVSDGDLRKAMLARRVMATPIHQIMNRNCITLPKGEEHQAQAVFERDHIFLLPVVDGDGRLLDVLTAY
jgi:CBS domain-containing protein